MGIIVAGGLRFFVWWSRAEGRAEVERIFEVSNVQALLFLGHILWVMCD